MIKKLLIVALLATGLLVRFYKFNNPVADWHSWRQADTASVTRNYIDHGIDLLNPIYHDLSNVPSGKDNPQGYRLVEVPIYNALSALLYQPLKMFHLTPEEVQRLVSIFFSLGSALLLFFITQKITKSFLAAAFTLVLFLFLPYNIYYSRTILPEPTAVFFMVLSLWFLLNNSFVLASLPLGISILLKPYTALLLFPLIGYLFLYKFYLFHRKPFFKVILFGLISLVPFILWRLWISRHPEGIPASDWLFNGGNIRFRPAWFRWLFDERLAKLILGSFGTIPFFLGFAYKKDRSQTILLLLSLGILLYFIVIARGNVQHDYYQTLIIPFVSIMAGTGLFYVSRFVFSRRLIGLISALVILIATIAFSWYDIQGYYQINNPVIVTAGDQVNQMIPPNATVVAPYNGDTAFLYQTHRAGWPIEIYDVNHIKTLVTPRPVYLVSVNFDNYTNMMMKNYPAIFKNNQFVILDLNQ
ncbi:hypothetical protein M1116_00530 [Patescibacteria group bacterium]|nr:hypothetical protein [Patescibacteria group bacterium]